jgi:hypothetical protein
LLAHGRRVVSEGQGMRRGVEVVKGCSAECIGIPHA